MEEKITNKILENMNNVNTVNKDMDEKIRNLTNNVDILQSETKETMLSINNEISNLTEQLGTLFSRLDALISNVQEFTLNKTAMQSDINKVRSTANINNGRLRGHDSRLNDLKAKGVAIYSRA